MPEPAARPRWILAEDRPLRLFTLVILYVAQGVSIGLFWFAIPAWMAAQRRTPTAEWRHRIAIGATVDPVNPCIFSGCTTKANSYARLAANSSSFRFSSR